MPGEAQQMKDKVFAELLPARVRWKQHKPPAITVRDAVWCLDLSDPVQEAWLERAAAHTYRALVWATTGGAAARDRMMAEYTSYMLQLPTWPAAVPKTPDNVPPIHCSQMDIESVFKSHMFVAKPAVSAAAAYIQAAWRGHVLRRRLSNPEDPLCRKRLLREFEGMNKRHKL